MRPGGDERNWAFWRVGYGALFMAIGGGLLFRAYTVGLPEGMTPLDVVGCGVTGLCFALAGLALLTHGPQDDACVDTSDTRARYGRHAPDSPSPRTSAFGGPRYRDVARPARPRRTLPRRLPAHP